MLSLFSHWPIPASTIIIWIWCFVQNPRGEPASQLPDGFWHVLPSQHEPGIKAHIQDYYQAPTFAGSWWESPKFRAPTRAWISSGEAEGAKQVGVVALEACLETIQLGCSVLPQSQNIASKLGEIMHLIYVPDSDNLVFLWTMSYSLWTMRSKLFHFSLSTLEIKGKNFNILFLFSKL